MQLAARPQTLRELTAEGSQLHGASRFTLSRFQPSTWRLFRSDRSSRVVVGILVAAWVLGAGLVLAFRLGVVSGGSGWSPWLPLLGATGLTLLLGPIAILRLRWRRSFFGGAQELEGIVRDIVSDDRGSLVDVRYQVRSERYSVRRLLSSEQAAGLSIGARSEVLVDPRRPERAEIKRAYL